jgi:Tfp pilus assembly protein PilE
MKKPKKSSIAGLTIVEALFATLILSVVLVAVGQGYGQIANMSKASTNHMKALTDAKKIMEHARFIVDKHGLTGPSGLGDATNWNNWIGQNSSEFSDLPPGVTRSFAVVLEGSTQYISHGQATVTWAEQTRSRKLTLDGFFTQRTAVL